MCPDNIPEPAQQITDTKMMSALSLAFMGDAVYELLVRGYVLSRGDKKVKDLHAESIRLANADFQAEAGEKLLSIMTEYEQDVYRRGKNAHSAHTPKNKSVAQYQKATAFEAVLGRLYLDGNYERIYEFFDIITGE